MVGHTHEWLACYVIVKLTRVDGCSVKWPPLTRDPTHFFLPSLAYLKAVKAVVVFSVRPVVCFLNNCKADLHTINLGRNVSSGKRKLGFIQSSVWDQWPQWPLPPPPDLWEDTITRDIEGRLECGVCVWVLECVNIYVCVCERGDTERGDLIELLVSWKMKKCLLL